MTVYRISCTLRFSGADFLKKGVVHLKIDAEVTVV
jgi:hypothetical protein